MYMYQNALHVRCDSGLTCTQLIQVNFTKKYTKKQTNLEEHTVCNVEAEKVHSESALYSLLQVLQECENRVSHKL